MLEFNARFGDPETQTYLTASPNGTPVDLLEASVNGTLDKVELRWNPMPSVCVVMASGGYTGKLSPKASQSPAWKKAAKLPDTKVFHAGHRATRTARWSPTAAVS